MITMRRAKTARWATLLRLQRYATFAVALVLCSFSLTTGVSAEQLSRAGLILEWNLDVDSSAVATDTSGFANNGAIANGIWQETDKGKALYFNGTYAYIRQDGSPALDAATQDLTISLWVNTRGNAGKNQNILNRGWNDRGSYCCYALNLEEWGTPTVNLWDANNGYQVGSSVVVTDGKWHHIAFVVNRQTNKAQIYVDGALSGAPVDISSLGPLNTAGQTLFVGGWKGFMHFVNGHIKLVKIFSRALTDNAINELYTTELKNSLRTGLVLEWNLDSESSGAVAKDTSGFPNNGEIVNGIWQATAKGQALYLNGTDAYIRQNYAPALDEATQDLTISLWLNSNGNERKPQYILNRGWSDRGSRCVYGINLEAWGTPTGNLSDANKGYQVGGNVVVTDGQWHHVAFVVNRQTKKAQIYVDGALNGAPVDISSLGPLNTAGQTLFAGSWKGFMHFFKGHIKLVKIYSRALTGNEIGGVYLASARAGLVLEWNLDSESSGAVAKDTSGFPNDGKIVNAIWQETDMGKALYFNGTDASIRQDYPTALDKVTQNLTISLWLNTRGNEGRNQYILNRGWNDRGSRCLYGISLEKWGTPTGNLWDANKGYQAGGNVVVTDGQWHHIAFVVNRQTKKAQIYVDGAPSGNPADISSLGPLETTGQNLFVGSWKGFMHFFKGHIKLATIYSRALADAEIVELANIVNLGDFGAVGDGIADDTAALQNAINFAGGKTLYIPRPPVKYKTDPLFLVSNLHIVFEPGTVIEANPGYQEWRSDLLPKWPGGIADIVLNIRNLENVIIEGNGSTIQMLRDEYNQPVAPGRYGEQRHCIMIGSSRNIAIMDMTLQRSGGDGLHIAQDTASNNHTIPSENIYVRGIKSMYNRRNGMAVTSVRGLLAENCEFNYNGDPTDHESCGINLESNANSRFVKNVTIRNCLFERNRLHGLNLNFTGLLRPEAGGPPLPYNGTVDVTVENCNFIGAGFEMWGADYTGDYRVNGIVTVRDCYARDCNVGFVKFASQVPLVLERCTVDHFGLAVADNDQHDRGRVGFGIYGSNTRLTDCKTQDYDHNTIAALARRWDVGISGEYWSYAPIRNIVINNFQADPSVGHAIIPRIMVWDEADQSETDIDEVESLSIHYDIPPEIYFGEGTYNLPYGEAGKVISDKNNGGGTIINLPKATAVGTCFAFIEEGGGTLKIVPFSGNSIQSHASIQTSVYGSTVILECEGNGSWAVVSATGNWTYE